VNLLVPVAVDTLQKVLLPVAMVLTKADGLIAINNRMCYVLYFTTRWKVDAGSSGPESLRAFSPAYLLRATSPSGSDLAKLKSVIS
jgi:hypothetical protein